MYTNVTLRLVIIAIEEDGEQIVAYVLDYVDAESTLVLYLAIGTDKLRLCILFIIIAVKARFI